MLNYALNHEYILTVDQWHQCFGFANNTTDVRITTFILHPAPWQYFNLLRIHGNTPKGNQIDYPAIRYLFYVIANTLQARGEFTRVNEEDMLILAKAAIVNCNLITNLGALLVFYLKQQALQSHGPICKGGVMTVLAHVLHINLGNIQPLVGSNRCGLSTLRACGMVSKTHGRYFLDIPGADYLIPTPFSNGLFFI